MERGHEFTAKVVPAELFENGETAQFVKRATAAAAARNPRCADCPDRLKRGHEAKQKVRRRLRVVYSAEEEVSYCST